MLPTLEIYESIERLQKPVIASVNGFAVGGGHVLQVVCDLTIAKESAVFRQVGPMMGSFDAGYGTWYLEDLVGKKKAKEIWFLNEKLTAKEALDLGLINKVVPDDQLRESDDGHGQRHRRSRGLRAGGDQGGVRRAARRGTRFSRGSRTTSCCRRTTTRKKRKSWDRRLKSAGRPIRSASENNNKQGRDA